MPKMKQEHIDKLTRGKKSGAKIGSRWVPHHLYQYEQEKLDRAMKYKFLHISNKDRVNLQNIWEKICAARKWDSIIIVTDSSSLISKLFINHQLIEEWPKKILKLKVKNYV